MEEIDVGLYRVVKLVFDNMGESIVQLFPLLVPFVMRVFLL